MSEIDALVRERDGYLRRGRADRAAAVEAELAARGHRLETAAPPAPSKEPRFACDQCDFEAASKPGLGAHRRTHKASD